MSGTFDIPQSKIKDPIIGIDLGTTFCCVGIGRTNKIDIVTNDLGKRTTPSMVSFRVNEILVGDAAKNIMYQNAENTIKDSKRLIGRRFNEPIVQEDLKKWAFTIKENSNGLPQYVINVGDEEKRYFPEEISSMILRKLKSLSEDFMGTSIKKAVITVPAYFNNSQREATKKAGQLAGFKSIKILNEPTAAAIAYADQNKKEEERIILVFDLGGGTFDVSIVKVNNSIYEVIAINGDNHLGGEDFNNLLADFVINEFYESSGIDIKNNKKAISRIMKHIEDAKIDLSTLKEVIIDIDGIYEEEDLNLTITRAEYEELCDSNFNKCIKLMDQTIKEANLTKDQINEVVLAGGSSRTPKIQEMITEYFGRIPYKSINPDEAIAYGAALAGIFEDYEDKGIQLKDKDSDDINDKDNLLGEISSDEDDEEIKDDGKKNIFKKQFEENDNLLGEVSDDDNEEPNVTDEKKQFKENDRYNNSDDEDSNIEKFKENNEKKNSKNTYEKIPNKQNDFKNQKKNEEIPNEKMDSDSDEKIEKEIKQNKNSKNDSDSGDEKIEKMINEDDKNDRVELAEVESENEEEEKVENPKLIIKDATPLSIGIGVAGGKMAIIIPKLSQLPSKNEKRIFRKTFTTFKDFATSYMVRIFEGEDELIKNNYLLGEFRVTGFEPKKRGEIIIELIFYLDHNSIITVKARQNDIIQKELIIKSRDDYTKEEIQKMKENMKEYRNLEKMNKKKAEIKNRIIELNNSLKKIGEQSLGDNQILQKVNEMEQWMKDHKFDDLEQYEKKCNELQMFYNNNKNNQ